jgi:hypothetical protein
MNSRSIEQAKDTDMASSINAIRRAAKRAGQVAAQTGTSLIVWHNGQIERVAAQLPDAQATEIAVAKTK